MQPFLGYINQPEKPDRPELQAIRLRTYENFRLGIAL
jgi:hypothetical protein